MKRNKLALIGWSAVLAVGVLCSCMTFQAQEKGRTLKLKLNYTGSGTVDEKHKIIIFLFDSPDFTSGGVMPIGSKTASAKDETATITDITVSPIYVATVFDPSGEYDGQSGPPPSGASMGLYSKEPGKPAAIEIAEGKTVEVELPFDDSIKMP